MTADASQGDGRFVPSRLVYLGSPGLAVPPLRALADAGFAIDLVVTNPDRRRGRGSGTTPTPVKAAAVDLGIPVSHDVSDVVDSDADLGVVVAFGQIIRPPVLAALAMVNLHFSLLPRWRGAAPVERAILAGDTTTGVDLMDVAEGLDTGAVHARTELSIGADETADQLRERLVESGSRLLVESLQAGLGTPREQVGEPTYAKKITPDDLHIDWTAPADVIHRQVRVGGAWTTRDGDRFKVWRTSLDPTGDGIVHPTGDGVIELLDVQPAGKPRLDARAWANGARWSDDDRLGS
ncbi:MAG: methionyl-tRNA formyltransferase [Acidimicrobiales bacterium]|nr:methionyl-tRNA formyltransferase [Acidimicrobiales bacterium]